MSEASGGDGRVKGPLVYRQSVATRVTHWVWAICLFFLLLSGLQIFNAHPALYIGQQSGFEFDNAVLEIGAVRSGGELRGQTRIFGNSFDTTGVLGASGDASAPQTAFPGAVTSARTRARCGWPTTVTSGRAGAPWSTAATRTWAG